MFYIIILADLKSYTDSKVVENIKVTPKKSFIYFSTKNVVDFY